MHTHAQKPTANSQQPTANSQPTQQPTANSQQPTANSQRVVCCVFHSSICWLLVGTAHITQRADSNKLPTTSVYKNCGQIDV
jgi:hypothetical protein